MKLFIGLDVSLAKTAVCVINEHGKIVKEAQVLSDPQAIVDFANTLEGSVAIIGLEAGPLSQWLHRGLADARLEVVLMENPTGEGCSEGNADQNGSARRGRDCPTASSGLVQARTL